MWKKYLFLMCLLCSFSSQAQWERKIYKQKLLPVHASLFLADYKSPGFKMGLENQLHLKETNKYHLRRFVRTKREWLLGWFVGGYKNSWEEGEEHTAFFSTLEFGWRKSFSSGFKLEVLPYGGYRYLIYDTTTELLEDRGAIVAGASAGIGMNYSMKQYATWNWHLRPGFMYDVDSEDITPTIELGISFNVRGIWIPRGRHKAKRPEIIRTDENEEEEEKEEEEKPKG